MTSKVTIDAHCGDDKEVHFCVNEEGNLIEEGTVQDGETKELFIHDNRVVSTREVDK